MRSPYAISLTLLLLPLMVWVQIFGVDPARAITIIDVERSRWFFVLLAVAVLISLVILRKWRLGRILCGLAFVSWFVFSASLAYRHSSFWMGVVSIGIIGLGTAMLGWIEAVMGQSFRESGIRWYQHAPKAIPGLKAELAGISVDVIRLDFDGAYLTKFSGANLRSRLELELTLRFRDRVVQLRGRPAGRLERCGGIGVQFRKLRSDLKIELGELLEDLKGFGYG